MKKGRDQHLLWESYRDAVNHKFVARNKQAAKDHAEDPSRAVGNKEPLTDLREKLQEDLITYFAGDGGDDGLNIDEVLALIDARFPASTISARIPESPWLEDTDENSHKAKPYFMYEWIKRFDKNGLERYVHRYDQSDGGAEIIVDIDGEVYLYETSDSGKSLHGKYDSVEEAKEEADSWT